MVIGRKKKESDGREKTRNLYIIHNLYVKDWNQIQDSIEANEEWLRDLRIANDG